MPTQDDLNALTAAAPLLVGKYKRAPRTMEEAIKRAYKALNEQFKNAQKDDSNALQVRICSAASHTF
jgi:hypothetical protein